MSYTTILSTQTDADSPLDQTLMDAIRTNLDDHETRISSLFAFGNSGIIDDFLGKDAGAPDASSWVTYSPGGGSSATIKASNHTVNVIANGAAGAGIRGTDGRIGIHMANHELTAVCQFRIKATVIGSDQLWGWQDRALADTTTRATTRADCIGVMKGTGTTWKFRFANGGTNTEVDSLGTPGSFGVWRITVTCSATAGNRVVRAQLGTTEANLADITGSPWTNTSSMPTGKYVQPSFFASDLGAGNGNWEIDYILAYTTTRPLAP